MQTRYLEWRAPTIVHITHGQAGAPWLYKILHACCPSRTVAPGGACDHVLAGPIQPGKIYPAVCATREDLARCKFPDDTRRFVVIRDLRDTLIALFASAKLIDVATVHLDRMQQEVSSCSAEEGLLRLIDSALPASAAIQESWIGGPDPVVRYEELVERDETLLERVLLRHCRLPTIRPHFRNVVRAHARERRGACGAWRDHFTPRVKDAFKARFGKLLVATGHEKDLNW